MKRKRIKSVKSLGKKEGYVYDLSMKDKNNPWFYGNNILLHNSAYFSVYEALKDDFDGKSKKLGKEEALSLYDTISEETNTTFPDFMDKNFNTGLKNGAIIQAERENLSDYSYFIKKKRYAMNLFEDDGMRVDKEGSNGKIKAMGIEIKRSDTPKEIQDALQEGLSIILSGGDPNDMIEYFKKFKEEYKNNNPWSLGRPSSANAVSYYTELYNNYYVYKTAKEKPRISGQTMGAIAWNILCDHNNENHLPRIVDGSKVITCKLKPNDMGFKSISYLTDQTTFPDWFKELPFDTDEMLQSVLYKKIENIFFLLDVNLEHIKTSTGFDEVFDKVSVDDMDFDDFF